MQKNKWLTTAIVFGSLSSMSLPALAVVKQAPPSLQHIKVPPIHGLDEFVADKKAAILLGKALFWDTQVGSDGQACASCHFHAGADNRTKNQLSPGLLDAIEPDKTFQHTASGGQGGPNYTLVPEDFPLHQLWDPDNRHSHVLFTTNDAVTSQGSFDNFFISVDLDDQDLDDDDVCVQAADSIFHVNGHDTRQAEPRHAPSMINAVFNFRNFWDGRANNVFNGVSPFGRRDDQARVIAADGSRVKVDLRNAALASQSVAPPINALESSCDQRSFADIGKKMLGRRALKRQMIDPYDSVLGPHRRSDSKGLEQKYEELVEQAFKSKWWASDSDFDGYSQMESNFSLFWGIALQLYQSTLISDQAPYDKFARNFSSSFDLEDGDKNALTDAQFRGLKIFLGKGKCVNCHKGPEFSGAATHLRPENEEEGLVERMHMNDGGVALYDNGFYNIGVTRARDDIGVDGKDPFGNPLSFTELFVYERLFTPDDPFQTDTCKFEIPFDSNDCEHFPINNLQEINQHRRAINGAFKTPILRNVQLTGPYMHNGGMSTLEQVVDFYNRGGNFDNRAKDPDIQRLGLSDSEKSDLVAFMHALTDPRVANAQPPFDHPQLIVANGHTGDEFGGGSADGILADEDQIEIPAVGAGGRLAKGVHLHRPFMDTAQGTPQKTMNLALNADATQSSTVFGGPAGIAVDGNAGGTSVTHTAFEHEPWLQVDLGQQHYLDSIVLWNRRNCCSARLKNFVVFVSEQDMGNMSIDTAMHDPDIWHYHVSAKAPDTLAISAKVKGRYVRVRLKDSNYLSLEELQVYGY